ncbi:putative retroelement protein, partial [Coprinellus micaceus]
IHNYPLRPNVTTMSNYVMFLSDHITVNSVVTYLSGIVMILEPYYPDVHQIHHSCIVRDTITGCRRLRNLPTSRKTPFTISMLQQISQQSSSSYDSTLFLTILLVGFHGLLRLGELCDPDKPSLRNPTKQIRRTSVKDIDNNCITFLLPATKVDRFFEGNLVLIKSVWPEIDAVVTFRRYLNLRDAQHPYSSPLWLTSSRDVPTRSFFIQHLRAFNLGSQYSGQSMRAGGAAAWADKGAPTDIIQALGHWSS